MRCSSIGSSPFRRHSSTYREHDSNLFNRVFVSLTTPQERQRAELATRTEAQRRRETLLSCERDLDLAVRRRWITWTLCAELKRQMEARCAQHQVIEKWWYVGWLRRLGLFLFLVRSGCVREVRWCTSRLLPFPIFLALGAIWSRTRSWIGPAVSRAGGNAPLALITDWGQIANWLCQLSGLGLVP